jgi:signal transduction histidine kinase
VRDITTRKATEAALLEREKLAVTGRLAATLAHEVNNPLEGISNLAFLLVTDQSLSAEARAHAELLAKEVQRAGEITRQTLGFCRASNIRSHVDVEQILDDVLKSKQEELTRKQISITRRVGSVPTINGFAGELRHVFENLIDNAIEAVEQGVGHIHVRTRNSRAHENTATICDNRGGIARASLQRIFEPFFTSKGDTGTRLGLWVTRTIVEKHAGTIRVRSDKRAKWRDAVLTVARFPERSRSASRRADCSQIASSFTHHSLIALRAQP